jgi:hypothetical protein
MSRYRAFSRIVDIQFRIELLLNLRLEQGCRKRLGAVCSWMRGFLQFADCLVLGCASAVSSFAQAATDIEGPKHKAWDMLLTAALSKVTTERTNGIRALGLLSGNARARELAENGLKDPKPEVRAAAAATALGQMQASESIPKLGLRFQILKSRG